MANAPSPTRQHTTRGPRLGWCPSSAPGYVWRVGDGGMCKGNGLFGEGGGVPPVSNSVLGRYPGAVNRLVPILTHLLTFEFCSRAGFIREAMVPASSPGMWGGAPWAVRHLGLRETLSPLPPGGAREPAPDTRLICGVGLAPCE